MASEYDALLESTPAQKSEYDALLAQPSQPKSSVLGEIGTAIKNTAVGFVKGLARPPSLAEIALPIFGGQIERQYEHAKAAEQAIRGGQPAATSIAQAYAPNVSELANPEATRGEKIQAGVNIAAEVAPFLVPALRGIGKYGVAGRSLSDIAFGAKPEPLRSETAAAEQIQKGGEISATQERVVKEGNIPKYPGDDTGRASTEAGGRGGNAPSPQAEAQAVQVAHAVPQPEQPRIISTAVQTPEGVKTGTTWNQPHDEIAKGITPTAETPTTMGEVTPKGQATVPDFAKRYNPETLFVPPRWAFDKYGKAFEDKIFGLIHAKSPVAAADVTPIWKVMTPAERQELLSRGFSVTNTRIPGQVALLKAKDAVAAKSYYRMQEKRASVETARPSATGETPVATPQGIQENQKGFIIREPDGTERFTNDRTEAAGIAKAAGQVKPENAGTTELHSQQLAPVFKAEGAPVTKGKGVELLSPDEYASQSDSYLAKRDAEMSKAIESVSAPKGEFIRNRPDLLAERERRIQAVEDKYPNQELAVANAITEGRPINVEAAKRWGYSEPYLLKNGYIKQGDVYSKPEPVSQPTETTAAAKPILPSVWTRDTASPVAESVGGKIIGSVGIKGESPHDLDLRVENFDRTTRENLEKQGFEYLGSSLVSPKEAKASGKPYSEGWQRAEHFGQGGVGGKRIDVWHNEPEASANIEGLRRQFIESYQSKPWASSLAYGDIGQVMDDIHRGRVTVNEVYNAVDNGRNSGTLDPQIAMQMYDRLAKETPPQTPAVTKPTTAQPLPKTEPPLPPETPEELGQALKEPGRTAGVANRVLQERAAKGEIPQAPAAGQGHLTEDIINKSRAEYSPERALVAAQNVRNGSLSEADAGQVRIHEEALTKIAANAEKALDADPKNPALQEAYNTAKAALTQWHNDTVQPMKTTWSNAGKSMQGETDIDTGSYIGLQKLAWDTAKRDFTAKEEPVMRLAAKRVSKLTDDVRSAISKAEDQVQKVLKPSKYMDLNQLRESLAETLKSITC